MFKKFINYLTGPSTLSAKDTYTAAVKKSDEIVIQPKDGKFALVDSTDTVIKTYSTRANAVRGFERMYGERY